MQDRQTHAVVVDDAARKLDDLEGIHLDPDWLSRPAEAAGRTVSGVARVASMRKGRLGLQLASKQDRGQTHLPGAVRRWSWWAMVQRSGGAAMDGAAAVDAAAVMRL